jgi:nitrogen fixation/metabolism regulation signal transduction histidine kinase
VQFLANPLQGFSHCLSSFWSTSGPYVVVLMAMLPLFIWDTLTLTNRIVGPICRLRSAIRGINRGKNIAPIQFRDGDFWQDLAAELNALTERLRQAERHSSRENHGDGHAESRAAVAS